MENTECQPFLDSNKRQDLKSVRVIETVKTLLEGDFTSPPGHFIPLQFYPQATLTYSDDIF